VGARYLERGFGGRSMPEDHKHYRLSWRRPVFTCGVRRPLKAASIFFSCSDVSLCGRPSILSWCKKTLDE